MEELDFQALLDTFRSNGFQAGERAILGHFGTVQTLLTLIFNVPERCTWSGRRGIKAT